MAEDVTVRSATSWAVAFRTLGCKVNRAESDGIAAMLLEAGANLVPEKEADAVVVNTCTVTAEADRKARKEVRRALSLPRRPTVVVTGCLAVRDPDGLAALGRKVRVEPDKSRVPGAVGSLLGIDNVCDRSCATRSTGEGFRSRVVIKVEDGCDRFCAYCIVPLVRGLPQSVPAREVVRQVEDLVAADAAEVVLSGINLGRYADDSSDLPELLCAVAATGVRRLRLSSIEPPDLTERLIETLSMISALCPHLHVPLQSGSDAVLAAMGRGYEVGEFSARIEMLRQALPGVAVTTDVIAGFPGERHSDAIATLDAVERLRFARLHVFRYSRRKGTRAAAMPDQVKPNVISKRAARLREAGRRLSDEYTDSRLGGTAEVLVEKVLTEDEESVAEGTTEDYLRVRFAGMGYPPGDLVEVRLSSKRPDHVVGKVVFPGANSLA